MSYNIDDLSKLDSSSEFFKEIMKDYYSNAVKEEFLQGSWDLKESDPELSSAAATTAYEESKAYTAVEMERQLEEARKMIEKQREQQAVQSISDYARRMYEEMLQPQKIDLEWDDPPPRRFDMWYQPAGLERGKINPTKDILETPKKDVLPEDLFDMEK